MSLDSHIIGAVITLCLLFVFWVTMFGIMFKTPTGLQNFVSGKISYPSGFMTKIFPETKAQSFTMFVSIVMIVIFIVLIVLGMNNTNVGGIDRDQTTIINPNIENFGDIDSTSTPTPTPTSTYTSTYKPIGYGPVIDRTKVRNWINGNSGISGLNLTSGQTAWLDGNGIPMAIPTEHFKALYGYIPPSFAYYPKGQTKNEYNFKNYKEGRENCMKACSLTDCVAVQTEVPENCSQRANPSGTGNSCGSNSEFSCTLFYQDIKTADDAYWTINQISSGSDSDLTNSPGCFEITGSSCLGKKYYEDNAVPTELIDKTIKPSQNPVTFCDSNVTSAVNCVKRPLLTTEYTQSNFPYYLLPVNASKIEGAITGTGDYSMVVPTKTYKNGVGSSCGVVNGKLVSCGSDKVCAQGESSLPTSNCWQVDTSSCSGTIYDVSSGATQLQNYKDNYQKAKDSEGNSNPGSNYDDLYPSCYYRQKLTVVTPVQFNCDSTIIQRGCWGSPSILYTDSLTSINDVAACSDTSVIPSSERCQNSGSLASCTGFPYSCGSVNGTNTLWVRQ